MSLSLLDKFEAPSGHFRLEVRRSGVLIDVFEENNLIVDGSKQTHARLIGGDVASRSVTQISFGTSLTAPVVGNTTITAPFTKAIDSVTYPATNQVRFSFSLGTAESNGKAIGEFGLLTAGGVLYARKTRTAALNKESDITLSGTWTITF
jgi:hypothetical protein